MHTRFQNVSIVLLFLWVAASVVPCHASITCDFAQAIPVGLVTNRTGKVFFQGPGSNTDLLDFFGSLLDPYSGWPVGFPILSTTIKFYYIINQFFAVLSTNHWPIINTEMQEGRYVKYCPYKNTRNNTFVWWLIKRDLLILVKLEKLSILLSSFNNLWPIIDQFIDLFAFYRFFKQQNLAWPPCLFSVFCMYCIQLYETFLKTLPFVRRWNLFRTILG